MIKPFKKNSIIYSFIGVLAVFALWFLLYFIVADKQVVPSPLIVIKQGFLTLKSGAFYSHLLNTILRVLLALAISFALGVSLAIISNLSQKFEGVMHPVISIIRSLPVLAVLLIIIVLVKRWYAPVVVCTLSLFPIIYSQTLNNLNTIDDKHREMLKLYNVPLKTQIFSVYLKGLAPLFIKELAPITEPEGINEPFRIVTLQPHHTLSPKTILLGLLITS